MIYTETSLTVVVVEPNKQPYIKTIEHTLNAIQDIIGGTFEPVPITLDNQLTYIICNDEGKCIPLPANRPYKWDMIHGTFFVCGYDGREDLCSLTDKQIKQATQMFALN